MRVPRIACSAVLAGLLLVVGSLTGAGADPGPGYFATGNVQYMSTIPIDTDSSGGHVLGHYFFVTSSRYLDVYDISHPLSPERIATMPLPQEPQFAEEDLDTNGRIMLVSSLQTFNVIDIRDPANPHIIGTIQGLDPHTESCILDCTYAYGTEGAIIDLRRPAHPKVVGDWHKSAEKSAHLTIKSAHDVTEVSPGLVLTATQPILLLDVREDPVHPKVLAVGGNTDTRFIHDVVWPAGGTDPFFLAGGETTGPCNGKTDGAFMTWNARNWRATHSFHMIDQFHETTGDYLDGKPAADQWCAHWFHTNPTYDQGGLVAMAWYDHGVRFFDVSHAGVIKEIGYFMPAGAQSSNPYWITKRLLYVVDYNRGIDILKFTGKL
jgi:hypothetical protein